ncbi:hypothetical protein LOTGIDRAFT_233266 [Lottia gigantea]|uniref:Uncharacterized protein n=1 Tax=Lottia gigantea TaxID=225164 RepID=V4AF56_LOTGI|nr:hypothetical protein LOTGIDRAFT_233266 [Lottia gigantea]ESO91966.1 hypothetical protein LOTGIDRAFT_233266 [Lottia gigantea]
MAENTTCQNFQNVLNAIKDEELHNRPFSTTDFIVIKLQRYLVDPEFKSQTSIDTTRYSDVFDVTLSDSTNQMKYILHPSLNHLIQNYQLSVGSLIKLKKCSVHFDESDLESYDMVIIHQLDITGQRSITPDEVNLPWYPETNLKQQVDHPLAGGRRYYIDVWSTGYIDLSSSQHSISDIQKGNYEENRKVYGDYYGLKDICKKWKTLQGSKPAIVVQILKISRLLHYVKTGKSERYPFQLHMLIGDITGCCTAVLWNSLPIKYLNILKEGMCILLQMFTVKKSYHSSSRWKVGEEYGNIFEIDININAHHPMTVLKIIDRTSISDNVIPSLQYHFLTRKKLRSIYDNTMCDVIGYVQFVGRMGRELMKNRLEGDSGCYWISRWVHVVDHTSYKPIMIQLYRPNQYSLFDNLKAGDILICRHLRVIQDLQLLTNSKQKRHLYLSSVAETQISVFQANTITDNLPDALSDQPIVNQFIKWYRTNQSKELLHCKYGGYFTYPPLPDNLDDFKTQHSDYEITNSTMWKFTKDSLVYRQHTRLYVQAVLVQIQFICNKLATVSHDSLQDSENNISQHKVVKDVIVNNNWNDTKEQYQHIGIDQNNQDHVFSVTSTDLPVSQVSLPSNSPSHQNTDPANVAMTIQKQDYFKITWMGLNSKIDITSVKICKELDDPSDFSDVLTKQCDIGVSEDIVDISAIDSVLNSARLLTDQRYLVVLDLYKHKDSVEIILNTAYPL